MTITRVCVVMFSFVALFAASCGTQKNSPQGAPRTPPASPRETTETGTSATPTSPTNDPDEVGWPRVLNVHPGHESHYRHVDRTAEYNDADHAPYYLRTMPGTLTIQRSGEATLSFAVESGSLLGCQFRMATPHDGSRVALQLWDGSDAMLAHESNPAKPTTGPAWLRNVHVPYNETTNPIGPWPLYLENLTGSLTPAYQGDRFWWRRITSYSLFLLEDPSCDSKCPNEDIDKALREKMESEHWPCTSGGGPSVSHIPAGDYNVVKTVGDTPVFFADYGALQKDYVITIPAGRTVEVSTGIFPNFVDRKDASQSFTLTVHGPGSVHIRRSPNDCCQDKMVDVGFKEKSSPG